MIYYLKSKKNVPSKTNLNLIFLKKKEINFFVFDNKNLEQITRQK